MYHDDQEEAEGVNDDVSFAPGHFFFRHRSRVRRRLRSF
jgi:hypothetical protein